MERDGNGEAVEMDGSEVIVPEGVDVVVIIEPDVRPVVLEAGRPPS